jgi:hypothetical protein
VNANLSLSGSFTVDHTTLYHCWKRTSVKDPTAKINCILPQLTLWCRVVYIGDIGGIRASLNFISVT